MTSFLKKIDALLDKKKFLVPLFLCLLTANVFGHILHNEFLMDDHGQIVENEFIHTLGNLPQLFFGSTFFSGSMDQLAGLYYRPLMMVCFTLIYHFFQLNPAPYHLLSLLFHTANAILVYRLIRSYLKPHLSFLASLLFLVHPINVEAVVYIANLQDLLYTFFGLTALNILVLTNLPVLKRHLYSLVLLFLALLSKEVGIIYIAVCCLWLYFHKPNEVKPFIQKVVVIVIIYGLMRVGSVGANTHDKVIPIASATLVERLLTLPQILWFYISTFFFPVKLAIAQQWVIRRFDLVNVLLPLIYVAGSSLIFQKITRFIQKKQKAWTSLTKLLSLWIIIGLGIYSQIIPLDTTVADRWMYSTGIAVIFLLFLALNHLPQKLRTLLIIALIPVIGLLSVRSHIRAADWKTSFTLITHDYPLVRSSFWMEYLAGIEYLKQGKYQESVQYLEKSVLIVPSWGSSWNNLGVAYEAIVDNQKALSAYTNAIKYGAGSAPAVNIGRLIVSDPALLPSGTAAGFFEKQLAIYPANRDLWYLKSQFEQSRQNYPAALAAAKQFYNLYPTDIAKEWYESLYKESQKLLP